LKLLGYKFGEVSNPEDKCVIPTFDDAYKDFIDNAFPALEEFGFKAYVFVPAGLVGKFNEWDWRELNVKKEIMSWEDLGFLVEKGYKIGSHTLFHPDLTKLSDRELEKEVSYSKKLLEDKLSVEIETFCYPYGRYDDRVVNAVKRAGYRFAFTVEQKKFSLKDPYRIGRIGVFGNKLFVLFSFIKKLYRY